MAQAYARQNYGYRHLIRDLGMTTEPGNRCALFDIALMFRGLHGELPQVNNDVSIIFSQSAHGLSGEIEYRNRLFKRESIERFRDHFLNVLDRGLSNVDLPITGWRCWQKMSDGGFWWNGIPQRASFPARNHPSSV